MTRVLLVIDVQQDWAIPNSDYYIEGLDDIVAEINDLIDAVREDGDKIIFTQNVELDDAGQPTQGSRFLPGLKRLESDPIVQKTTVSPFFDGKLDDLLEGVEELLICGLSTNLAVRQTVEEAYDRDFDITVFDSACASPSEYAHVFTLKDLELTRDEITVIDVEEFLEDDDEDEEEAPAAPQPAPVQQPAQAPAASPTPSAPQPASRPAPAPQPTQPAPSAPQPQSFNRPPQ